MNLDKKEGLTLNSSELCRALGIDNRTASRWKRDGLEVRKEGRANVYAIRKVIEFLKQREYDRGVKAGKAVGRLEEATGEAELDAGSELAKQRYEAARKLKMENDLREQKLALRAEVDDQARFIGIRFRTRGESLQRKYGDEVGDDLRELLDQVQEDLQGFLK